MKLRYILVAVLAVLAISVSCSKEETLKIDQNVKVSFSVADKATIGAETKAVKTAWEAGDQIIVFLKPNIDGKDYSAANFLLKYNGTQWTEETTGLNLSELGTAGNYVAIHYRVTSGNDITHNNYYILNNYAGGETLASAVSSYTISGSTLDLGTIFLNMTVSQNLAKQLQVSISNLEPSKTWNLKILKKGVALNSTSNSDGYSMYIGCPLLHKDTGNTSISSGSSIWETLGVKNNKSDEKELSFVFLSSNESITQESGSLYRFILNDGTDNYEYVVNRGNAVEANNNKFEKNLESGKAYKLPAFDGNTAGGTWKKVE